MTDDRRPTTGDSFAAALMAYAGQPLEPDRAVELAERLARVRVELARLDRLYGLAVEPCGLVVPPPPATRGDDSGREG